MSTIIDLLGTQAGYYLDHVCKTIDKKLIHIPEPNMIDKAWVDSDRNIRTLESLQALYGHGRLANTGYVSILPVDQGIEHSAGASFAPNPLYFDPGNIVKLAIEGGCNAVASTFGVLGAVARKYAHKIPFIVKLNHNELLTYPNSYDQVMFGTVSDANMKSFGLKRTSRIKTFVFKYVSVPAKWIKTARQHILNIYTSNDAYMMAFKFDFG
jgi:fructose-bisphosphate aldolase, class I